MTSRLPAERAPVAPGRPRSFPAGRRTAAGGGYAAGVSSDKKRPRPASAPEPPEPAGTDGPDGPGDAAGPGDAGARPGRLTGAAAVCAVEALALFVWGVYLLVMGLLGRPDSPQQAEMGGITLIALGAIPLLAARGLLLRRSWSRGPALITQIMALPVAYTLLTSTGGLIPAGIALAALAVTGLVLIVNPTTTEALGIRGPAGGA